MNKTWFERVKDELKEQGKTQASLMPVFGVTSRGAIGHYLSGRREPDGEQLANCAQYLNVSLDWMISGREPKHPVFIDKDQVRETSEVYPSLRVLPFVETIIHKKDMLGPHSVALPDNIERLTIAADEQLAASIGKHAFASPVQETGMLPRFTPGDIVIIDPDATPSPGDIVMAALDDHRTILLRKYRQRSPEIIELVPLNDDYPTLTIDADHPGEIVGRVMEHRARFL